MGRRSGRRKRVVRPEVAPPVAVTNHLALYRAMFPELGDSPDTPTVVEHVAACPVAQAIDADPGECSCPDGWPRVTATVRDGWDAVDQAGAELAALRAAQG